MHIPTILIITALTTVLTARPTDSSKHKRGISKSKAQPKHSRTISSPEKLAEMVQKMALGTKETEIACMVSSARDAQLVAQLQEKEESGPAAQMQNTERRERSRNEAKPVQDQTPEELSGMMDRSMEIIDYNDYSESMEDTISGPQQVNYDLSEYQKWITRTMREKIQRIMENPEYHNKAMDTLQGLMEGL